MKDIESSVNSDHIPSRSCAANSGISEVLGKLSGLISDLNEFEHLDEFLDLVAETAANIVEYDGAIVFIGERPGMLRGWGSYGLSQRYVNAVANWRSNGNKVQVFTPVKVAWYTGRPSAVPDVEKEPRLGYWLAHAREEGIRSFASFPLRAQKRIVGVLSVYKGETREFTKMDTRLVTAVADVAAAAVRAATDRADQEDRLLELQRAARHRAVTDEVHAELNEILLSGGGFQAVADVLRERVGAAILIEDSRGRLLAASAQNRGRSDVRRLVEFARDAAAEDSGDRGVRSFSAFGCQIYKVPVMAGERRLAHVWTSMERDPEPSLTQSILEYGARAVALALVGGRAQLKSRQRDDDELFSALLTVADPASEARVTERAVRQGYDLQRPQFMVVITEGEGEGSSLDGNDLALRLRSRFSSIAHTFISVADFGVCVLVPLEEGEELVDEHRVVGLIKRVVSDQQYGREASVLIFGEVLNIHGIVQNVEAARTLRKTIGQSGEPQDAIDVRSLGVYRLLLQVASPEQLLTARDTTIGLLLSYDDKHRTALVETLSCYLRNNMNAKATAKQLVVHINTLTYRLRRIEEILGVELKSPSDLMNIQFGMYVQSILTVAGSVA